MDPRCQGFEHVYHPARLEVLATCVHVTGIVEAAASEADGDRHIRLRVDRGQLAPDGSYYTNQANRRYQHGDLVAEPVCVGIVTQADAVAACGDYYNPTWLPRVGDHVRASGPWVLDQQHHGWAEIHPATFERLP